MGLFEIFNVIFNKRLIHQDKTERTMRGQMEQCNNETRTALH